RLRHKSTLFPYTTLFRSRAAFQCIIANLEVQQHQVNPYKRYCKQQGIEPVEESAVPGHNPSAVFHTCHSLKLAFQQIAKCSCNRDRKSTRLNSSHAKISY